MIATRRRTRRSWGSGSLFRRDSGGPWIARFHDAAGRRIKRSTGTHERQAAERILRDWLASAALRRSGVVTGADEAIERARRRAVPAHLADYITFCGLARQAPRAVSQKRAILSRWVAEEGIARLADIDADGVRRYLARVAESGRSARTVNAFRAVIIAFVNWLRREGRIASNPIADRRLPRLDEAQDQRRRRRALTLAEQSRLLAVAASRGRWLWYALPLRAGLRRGDLVALRWGDLDLDDRVVTITRGKARRVDRLPLVADLVDALRAERARVGGAAHEKVFPTAPTSLTQRKDFERAGLVRRVPVVGADGEPVMVGRGRRRRQATRLTSLDGDGLALDLHALRGTLCTDLLRAGVPVPHAQRLMRHADARTTLRHYARLTLTDLSEAVDRLPSLARLGSSEKGATRTA